MKAKKDNGAPSNNGTPKKSSCSPKIRNLNVNSLASNQQNQKNGLYECQKATILKILSDEIPRWGKEIAQIMDTEYSSITAAILKLKKQGRIIVCGAKTTPSARKADLLTIVQEQAE